MKLTTNEWLQTDLKHNWHPCSQAKDFEKFPPLLIKTAQGPYIQLQDGRKLIDAISSWWCKSVGHGHPVLKTALKKQLEAFEHVMFGQTTYEQIICLAQKLSGLTQSLNKIFYASDGSSAVEIALKMSLHAQQIQGKSSRTRFMSLENAYHGETTLAMSVSDLGIYRDPYVSLLQSYPVLKEIPYVTNREDPLWSDCSEVWPKIQAQLEMHADYLSAIIVEPIVQGAAGMKIYSKDFLQRLRIWTLKHGIHLIADEIMTGLYRTGLPLACDHSKIEPDFLCLGKGLTGGFLPLSVVMTSKQIYDLFYDGEAFLHSHTHSGNALAVSVALAMLDLIKELHCSELEIKLGQLMQELAIETKQLTNVRYIGGIAAATLCNPDQISRPGYHLAIKAAESGVLLRPIGNELYWLPPLNIENRVLFELKEKTKAALLNY